jgi:signal peptidase I
VENKEVRKKVFETIILLLKTSFVAGVIVLLLRGFLFIPVEVTGQSMESTLMQSDLIIMERFSTIKRFDVVVIRLKDAETLVKRVIGLPGDSIKFQDNQLYVNDQKVKEPFLANNLKNYHQQAPFTNDFTLETVIGKTHLDEGEYFVLGDNRPYSRDSRLFGVVHEEDILGKGLFVYYPFQDMKWLRRF